MTATTTGCFTQGSTDPTLFTTTSAISLNGVPVPPVPGTQVSIHTPTSSAPGGSISVDASITVAGFTLNKTVITKNFPFGTNGQEGSFIALAPSGGQKFLGLDLTGSSVAWNLGRDSNGAPYAKFAAILALPSVLKNGPEQGAGGLTGTVAFRINQDGALKTDAVKLEVANAFIGSVGLKHLCLSYTAANQTTTTPCSPPLFGAQPLIKCEQGAPADRWDGSAVIVLPTASRAELGVFAGFRNGQFGYGGAQVSNLGDSVPIATNVFLDRAGLGLCVNPPPFKITASAGIRIGPRNFALINGSLEYINSRPWVLKADGSLDIAGNNVGEAHIKYVSTGDIDFDLRAGVNVAAGAFKATGSLTGWYQSTSRRFDIFGTGNVCIAKIPGACLGGDVAVSNVGVAGCVRLGGAKRAAAAALLAADGAPPTAHAAGFFGSVGSFFRSAGQKFVTHVVTPVKHGAISVYNRINDVVQNGISAGAGYRWNGGFQLMASSCDVGPYRAQKAAFVAAARGPKTITLPNAPGVTLNFGGLGRPPKFELISPDGKDVIMANRTGRFVPNEYLYAHQGKSTIVTIPDPVPGQWKIKVLKGSPPIMTVAEAKLQLPALVGATVTGAGHRRTLAYVDERKPGESVQFWERTSTDQVLIGNATGPVCPALSLATVRNGDTAHPNCGKLSFRPGPGPAGLRQIVAVLMRNGEPIKEIPVAKYHAPGEVPLKAPAGETIQRNGTTVGVTWTRVAGAKTYDILYKLNDGEQQVVVAPATAKHVVLPEAIDPADNVTVIVRPVKSEETSEGPGKTATSQGDPSAGTPMPEGA
ncbi:MAG: hypothetical protein ACJ780_16955 [Solirubrobacteraceae bacterium]